MLRKISIALILTTLLLSGISVTAQPAAQTLNLTQYVNTFIGTDDSNVPNPVGGGAGGSTIPGAMVPFGMVQFSPDTPTASPSGYRYSDTTIEEFSMTHFNGAGCANNEDINIMPITGSITTSPGSSWTSYASGYTKANESAVPGYYKNRLDKYSTTVELTATKRTGMMRLTYPATTSASILINTSRSATGSRSGGLTISGSTITGNVTAGGFCGNSKTFKIYFAIAFDRAPSSFGTWLGSTVSSGSSSTSGTNSGGWVTFNTSTSTVVQMKIALSYVSVANAQQNLNTENSAWAFSTTQANASTDWNNQLNRIQVSGGTSADLQKFYTALYHVLSNPNIASDVNGQYMGFDYVVHTSTTPVYQNYSGWDIYRSWAALMGMVYPEASDIMKSMVLDGQQGGLLPKWSHEDQETWVMTGDPGPIIVSSAYAFGARNFDTAAALALMDKVGSQVGATMQGQQTRGNLQQLLNNHYICGNASDSIEYNASDFAIAMFAKALGDTTKYNNYINHSQWWINTFNTESQFIHYRNCDGTWPWPLDPKSETGYTEGNAAQYSWMVPHNFEALFRLMGGKQTAVQRLDHLFTQVNAGLTLPYFYIGNEPEHNQPWAYNFAGAPWGAQSAVRRIMNEVFTTGPGGLPGNDDLGATSAVYVWGALGMFPVTPGADTLALHGPLFTSTRIQLANNNIVQINGSGAGTNSPYIQSLNINGVGTTHTYVRYPDISGGATFNFTMGAAANKGWGIGAADAPPSFTDGMTMPAVPPTLGTNLALGKTATADSSCAANEGASLAVDGSLGTKWCSLGAAPWLQIDLGSNQTVTSFVIKHAALGGETTGWNTGAFNIQTSTDAATWTTVVTVSGNRTSRTYHPITARTARYVRLNVTTPTNNGNNAARIYEVEVYGSGSTTPTNTPVPPTPVPTSIVPTNTAIAPTKTNTPTGTSTVFSTGLETGQTMPTWTNTVETANGGISNVGGICCGLTGPELGARTGETAHGGTGSIMYSGLDNSATSSFAYMQVFNVNIPVVSTTKLSYWIFPQSSATSPVAVSGSNSTCVAIDMVFTDGSNLRDSGVNATNGFKLHPATQCAHSTLDAWNNVQANLGALAGKTIARINIAYDQPANTGGYRGYVDDIVITQ